VSVSPDYCFRTLSNNDGSSTSDLIISSRNNIETAKIGCTAGFNFSYNFSKRIGIGTGIHFSNKGYQIKTGRLTFGDVNQNAGFTIYSTSNDPSIPQSAKNIYNYYYIDIPLKATITFGSRSFRFVSSVGVSTNILMNASQTNIYEYQDGSLDKSTQASSESFQTINFSPEISVGVEKRIKDKIFIRVEPAFRYGVLKIIDAPITANLWSAGLNVSYYFGLK
jgi:hypothetical protein